MRQEIKILCVDDEPNVLNALKRLFLDENYTFLTASSAREGFGILEQEDVQIVVSDYRMPKMNGVEFLREVYQRWPDTVRIVLSGYADSSATVAAINEGQIYKFVPKPWNDDELLVTIKNAVERYELYKLKQELTEELLLKNNELISVNAHLSDLVAERSRSLEFAAKSLALHQSLLNAMPVGVLGLDPDNMIVMCNASCGSVYGDSKPAVGNSADAVMPEDVKRFIGLMKNAKRAVGHGEIAGRRIKMIGSSIENQGVIIVFIPEDDNA